VGVQETRWDEVEVHLQRIVSFSSKESEKHELVKGSLVYKRIMAALKRAECLSDRTSLSGRRCDVIVLNAQGATEDESEDSKGQISHETAICPNLEFHKGDRKNLTDPLQTNTNACWVFMKI
jgi:hypothetical protein